MKKLVLFSALFALTVGLFFTACKKDEIPQANTRSSSPANPNNPYDQVGLKHNEGLDILAQDANASSTNMAEKFQTLAAHGYGNVEHSKYAHDFALLLSSAEPIKTISDKLNAEHKLSAQLYNLLVSLNEIVVNYGMTAELSPKVMAFEQNIATMGLDESENKTILVATSIARYSNAYWINKLGESSASQSADRRRDPRATYILGCDVVAGIAFVASTEGVGLLAVAEVSAVASELAANWWDFWHRSSGGKNIGWAWGEGTEGTPCKQGYSDPCTIELNPGKADPFYMLGAGFAINSKTFVLVMDGSELDPGFKDIFKSGEVKQITEYTVSDDILKEVYTSGGIPVPSEPTIFTKGSKKVLPIEGGYCILYPVTYKDGSTTTWYVVVNQESE